LRLEKGNIRSETENKKEMFRRGQTKGCAQVSVEEENFAVEKTMPNSKVYRSALAKFLQEKK